MLEKSRREVINIIYKTRRDAEDAARKVQDEIQADIEKLLARYDFRSSVILAVKPFEYEEGRDRDHEHAVMALVVAVKGKGLDIRELVGNSLKRSEPLMTLVSEAIASSMTLAMKFADSLRDRHRGHNHDHDNDHDHDHDHKSGHRDDDLRW